MQYLRPQERRGNSIASVTSDASRYDVEGACAGGGGGAVIQATLAGERDGWVQKGAEAALWDTEGAVVHGGGEDSASYEVELEEEVGRFYTGGAGHRQTPVDAFKSERGDEDDEDEVDVCEASGDGCGAGT